MTMKRNKGLWLAVVAICVGIVASCSGKKADNGVLVEQAARINTELTALADGSEMFIESASAAFADGTLTVDIAFADSIINMDMCSDALVQFALSQYLKAHTGADLDATLNTLGKEKGIMSLHLTDVYGNTKVVDLPSATVKRLAVAKMSELPVAEVRSNVVDIMAQRCPQYAAAVNATGCTFDYAASFAQYTLTFRNTHAFANQTTGSLTGRYQNTLRAIYDNYGDCAPMVSDMLQALQIDGYRFIYSADGKELKCALPWRMII